MRGVPDDWRCPLLLVVGVVVVVGLLDKDRIRPCLDFGVPTRSNTKLWGLFNNRGAFGEFTVAVSVVLVAIGAVGGVCLGVAPLPKPASNNFLIRFMGDGLDVGTDVEPVMELSRTRGLRGGLMGDAGIVDVVRKLRLGRGER